MTCFWDDDDDDPDVVVRLFFFFLLFSTPFLVHKVLRECLSMTFLVNGVWNSRIWDYNDVLTDNSILFRRRENKRSQEESHWISFCRIFAQFLQKRCVFLKRFRPWLDLTWKEVQDKNNMMHYQPEKLLFIPKMSHCQEMSLHHTMNVLSRLTRLHLRFSSNMSV